MGKKTLMKFYGEWCGPCKILDGVMKNLDRNAAKNILAVGHGRPVEGIPVL